MPTIEELTKENEKLKEENEALLTKQAEMERKMMGLRFSSNSLDLEDMYKRKRAAVDVESPEVGTRVKIVNKGCRYSSEDFKQCFDGMTCEFTDTVENLAMGVIIAKAEHFKKKGSEVFLVMFDNKKAAVIARKGIEVAFWIGAYVKITSTGSKYAAKDFQQHFPGFDIIDDCHAGQKGVIVDIQPHYKAKNVSVLLVAVDGNLRCVVMNGKGCTPFEHPDLRDYIARKQKEEAKRKAEAEAQEAPDAKKQATEQEGVAADGETA